MTSPFEFLTIDHWMLLVILVFQVGQFVTRTTSQGAGLRDRVSGLEEWTKAHTALHDASVHQSEAIFMRKDLVMVRLEEIERRLETLEKKIDSLPGKRRTQPIWP